MRRTVVVLLLELLPALVAAGADAAVCGVRKGLYDGWLASEKRVGGVRARLMGALVSASTAPPPDEPNHESIGQEYRAFFQCLAGAAESPDLVALQSSCKDAAADGVASLVCETALYLKEGRTGSKEFVDALPVKKLGELVWDLDAIAATAPDTVPIPAIFLPNGPAYTLLDELFLLVLDGKEDAASKYLAIASVARGEGARHTDEQIKVLLRESPAVGLLKSPILRQYQPNLKKLVSELAPSELLQMRKGLIGFCSKDNLDCPEILKFFVRKE